MRIVQYRALFVITVLLAAVLPGSSEPAVAAPMKPAATLSNNVLILGPTVTDGLNSLEANAIRAQGLNPVVVDSATWQGMTTAQFATYRALVFGDPTCDSETTPAPYAAATASVSQWGNAVNGNVTVIGTDPVYHATTGSRPDADKLITAAMNFVLADASRTGGYMDLSCSYGSQASQPTPVLAPFGSFTVHGVGCEDSVNIVAHQAALTGLTNADLIGWHCSVHEAFSAWPGPQSPSGAGGDFLVLSIDVNSGSSFHASDGTVGDPYILARGPGLIPITSGPTEKCGGARFQFPTKGHIGWLYQDPRSQWDKHIDTDDFGHPTIHAGLDFWKSGADDNVWPLAAGVIKNMNPAGTSGNIWYNDTGPDSGISTYITELQFNADIITTYKTQGFVNVDPNHAIGKTGPTDHVHMSFSKKVGAYNHHDDFNVSQTQDPSHYFAADLFEPSGATYRAYIESADGKTAPYTGVVPVNNADPTRATAVLQPADWKNATGSWPLSFDQTNVRNPYLATPITPIDPYQWTGSHFCNVVGSGLPTTPTPSRIIDTTTPMVTGGTVTDTFWLDGALLGLQQLLNVVVGPVYSDVDVTLTRPDGGTVGPTDAGVQYHKVGNFVTYTIQNAQTGQWGYSIVANALDPAGENVRLTVDESNGSPGITDLTGPATAIAVSPSPQSSGPISIVLTALDNPGGSGMQSITYGTSGADTRTMVTASGNTVNLIVKATGATTLYYYATDVAGNREVLRSLDLQIIAPVQLLAQPQRLVDTRSAGGAIAGGTSRCFGVAGVAGIPADAAAVLLNVTAVGQTTNGWLSVFPAGQPVPPTSTLNFGTSEYAMANDTIMRLGTGGQVCVSVGTINAAPGGSQVILDATGFLPSTALGQLAMVASPVRLADTRTAGGRIATGASRCFPVAGVSGIPGDAAAVVLNLTAVGYSTNGWLSAFPNGQSVPPTSTLNFDASEYAMASGTIVRIGAGGQVCVNVGTINSAAGSSDVVLDVTGYLTAGALAQLPMLTSPQRLADTRAIGGPIATGASRCFALTGVAGIPANATAVVLNVTAVGYTSNGWLTAYASGQAVPATSTLNFDASEYAMANGTIIALGTGGQVCINVGTINSARGSANVVLDVVGYLVP